MSDKIHKGVHELLEHVGKLGEDKVAVTVYEIASFEVGLDDLTTRCGRAFFEEDVNKPGNFVFDVSLGPVNARRLVDFLLSLPIEPDEEEGKVLS